MWLSILKIWFTQYLNTVYPPIKLITSWCWCDVAVSQNVEIWINWIPKSPMTSVFSDAKLDLVFSKSSSAWWLGGKRKVSLRKSETEMMWREACYNTSEKKHKLRNLRKFSKTVAKSQQLEGLETLLFVETRDFKPTFYVQSIHLPRVGWNPPVAIAPSTRQKVLPWPSADTAMRGWLSNFALYGCFLPWWYPQNTPKWWFLVGKPMAVGYHHFRKPPYRSGLPPSYFTLDPRDFFSVHQSAGWPF